MGTIDLNADLGESYGVWQVGDDEAMLGVVTSANVACGFHAGDPSTLRRTCRAAVARGVAVGAQISYPDLAGFGRRFIEIEADELRDVVLYQLGALAAFARAAGTSIRYIKPHGALYHACSTHPHQAEAVVRAAREFDPDLAVLGAPGSALLGFAADAGMRAVAEAYADRAYREDGTLVPRTEPGAVLHDPAAAAAQAVELARRGAESICVHGDTPGAVEIAVAVRHGLETAGLTLQPFTGR